DEPDDDGARSFVKEVASLPQADSVRRLVRTTSSINDRIQPIATPIVIFVNTSPALVPNALEPPTPPNAPAKPPPLPRWIRMMQIMNSEPRTIKALRMPMRKLTSMSLEHVGQAEPDWEPDPVRLKPDLLRSPAGHISRRTHDKQEVIGLEA